MRKNIPKIELITRIELQKLFSNESGNDMRNIRRLNDYIVHFVAICRKLGFHLIFTFDEDALRVDGESVEVLGPDGVRAVNEAQKERAQLVAGDVGKVPVVVQTEVHGHAPLADAVQRQHFAADEPGVVLRPADQQIEQLLVGARLLAVLGRVGVHQRRLEGVARKHAQVGAERQQRHLLVRH